MQIITCGFHSIDTTCSRKKTCIGKFLKNVLNDPVNTIEELTARVMQTADNIRENPEMLVVPKVTSLLE
jgi:hypothetical protein